VPSDSEGVSRKRKSHLAVSWKFKNEHPIPIVTPYIESVNVPTRARQRFAEVGHTQYARLTDEVNQEIEERVEKYLQLVEASEPVGRKERKTVE